MKNLTLPKAVVGAHGLEPRDLLRVKASVLVGSVFCTINRLQRLKCGGEIGGSGSGSRARLHELVSDLKK